MEATGYRASPLSLANRNRDRKESSFMKVSWSRIAALLIHALASLLFTLGFASESMSARYNVYPTLPEVLSYLTYLASVKLLTASLFPIAITGLLFVQIRIMPKRTSFNVMAASLILLFAFAAALLNSNTMQGAFSFIPDGIRTVVAVFSGRLSENDWSADTWVLQASMTCWFLLWFCLLLLGNVGWNRSGE